MKITHLLHDGEYLDCLPPVDKLGANVVNVVDPAAAPFQFQVHVLADIVELLERLQDLGLVDITATSGHAQLDIMLGMLQEVEETVVELLDQLKESISIELADIHEAAENVAVDFAWWSTADDNTFPRHTCRNDGLWLGEELKRLNSARINDLFGANQSYLDRRVHSGTGLGVIFD